MLFPTVIYQLIDAYTKDVDDIVGLKKYALATYWERRTDAPEGLWFVMLKQAPHLAVHCPCCPLICLIQNDQHDLALRLLTDPAFACRRWSRAELGPVLQAAVEHGQVPILEALRTHGGLSKVDAQQGVNLALLTAVASGYVNVLHELRTNWGLDANDARCRNDEPMWMAVELGHVHVLQELRINWKLGPTDARAYGNRAIQLAARWGKVNVLQELRTHWSLGPGDARAENNLALRWACTENHLAVLHELRLNWGLNKTDVDFILSNPDVRYQPEVYEALALFRA